MADPEKAPEGDRVVDNRPLQALRRRAYEELDAAIEEGGSQLSFDWFAHIDPDLASLRRRDEPEWRLLLERHRGDLGTGGGRPRDDRPGSSRRRRPRQVLERYVHDRRESRLPEPAWGDPRRRRNAWLISMASLVALAVAAWRVFGVFGPVLVVIVAFATVGAPVAWRERRRLRDEALTAVAGLAALAAAVVVVDAIAAARLGVLAAFAAAGALVSWRAGLAHQQALDLGRRIRDRQMLTRPPESKGDSLERRQPTE